MVNLRNSRVSDGTLRSNGHQMREFFRSGAVDIKTVTPPTPVAPSSSPGNEDLEANMVSVLWQAVTNGKIDFLELFAGSAHASAACAAYMRVGNSVDLRNGFDLNARTGQR